MRRQENGGEGGRNRRGREWKRIEGKRKDRRRTEEEMSII